MNLSAQSVNDWENPDVFGINKEKPHAALSLSNAKTNIPEVVSFNGICKFKWSPNPQSRPADFYNENFPTDKWEYILVPRSCKLQGFGAPIYTNINYPFITDQLSELPQRDFINLNINFTIHGVGGNDSWGAQTLDKYTIDGYKPFNYGLSLNI